MIVCHIAGLWVVVQSSSAQEMDEERPLATRKWVVPADFPKQLLDAPSLAAGEHDSGDSDDPFVGGDVFWDTLPRMIEQRAGIANATDSKVEFSPYKGELVVTDTRPNLNKVDLLVKSMGAMHPFLLDEKLFKPQGAFLLNRRSLSDKLVERTWHIHPSVMDRFLEDSDRPIEPDPFANGKEEKVVPARERPLSNLLAERGLAFPLGSSISYNRAAESLKSINTDLNAFWIEIVFFEIAVSMGQPGKGAK